MKVRRLVLRNFRRHKDTALEFPDGVTAVIGPNGAGKSSLLEGITFALFGAGAARTPKDLLRHTGAPPGDGVHVELDLDLGGQAVAIVRELRGKNLTPNASLTIDGNAIVAAGAGSSEAVTSKVEAILGMERDAFFTTVVARQGELARLANERPADRKRLVLKMVGVDRIDGAVEKAREARRQAEARLEAARLMLGDAKAIEERIASLRIDAQQTAARLKGAEATLIVLQRELTRARADAQASEADMQRWQGLRQVEAIARAATDGANAALRDALASLHEAEKAQDEADKLAPTAAMMPVRQAAMQEALQREDAARRRAIQLQSIARLEREVAGVEAERAELIVPPATTVQTAQQVCEAAAKATELSASTLAVAESQLRETMEKSRHISHLGTKASCPTCEQSLEGQYEVLKQRLEGQRVDAMRNIDAARAAHAAATARLQAARDVLAHAQGQERARIRTAAHAQALDSRLAQSQRLLAEARSHVTPETPVPDLIAIRKALEDARGAHDLWQRSLALAARLPAARAGHQVAHESQQKAQASHVAATSALAASPDPTAHVVAVQAALRAAEGAERKSELALHETRAHHAAALAELGHAEIRQAEEVARRTQVVALEREATEWGAIAGRTGGGLLDRFRDHLVDRVGPAVQVEASRLLSLFTGGRFTEIILDTEYNLFVTEDGTPYTLDRFSGGQQDLVHLALRLAVSRLVAERSGAELRFLALDEVFGHLDREHRDLVVQALHGLGGLYAQVLVVSHMESLHEALDQAIVVSEEDGEAVVTLRNG